MVARLEPSESYGAWWYNRTRTNTRQVPLNKANGKEYKRRTKYLPRSPSDWIAVPVPYVEVPLEWVCAARAATEENHKQSNAGRRA